MFCRTCGTAVSNEAHFCSKCGSAQEKCQSTLNTGTQDPRIALQTKDSIPKEVVHDKKKVKTFIEFQKAKGKQWKSLVSKAIGKKKNPDGNVLINIGLYEWNIKHRMLKPKRGKRLALSVSNIAPYAEILRKAVDKWKSFHSDCFDEEEDYMLLLEDGKEALFLPGSHKEFFTLKKYREELGKDYNKIILYLCARSDFIMHEDGEENGYTPSTSKRSKLQAYFNNDSDAMIEELPENYDNQGSPMQSTETDHVDDVTNVNSTQEIKAQVKSDEIIAKNLQYQLDNDELVDVTPTSTSNDETGESSTSSQRCPSSQHCPDLPTLVKQMEKKVDKSSQFFLVVRRGAPFQRSLSIWQRACKKSSPHMELRVKYMGENGIDSGAMSKEFLSDAVSQMGPIMFSNGSPVDSIYNIQNGNFRCCGEIAATSIIQGGPPPCFLDESVYNILINPDIDITNLDLQKHFTASDRKLLESIKEDIDAHRDTIIEHGYTGSIDNAHKNDIVETVMVSIISRRLLYLKEFAEGLKLCDVFNVIKDNVEITKELFVRGNESQKVDADYVYSLMSPEYSDDGTSRRTIENSMMDNFQDFLIALEDESICGYSEALAWKGDDPREQVPDDAETAEENSQFKTADLTPAGILGWLTGQRHVPLNGENLIIVVKFDHDCLVRNPNHTICFPTVGACGRVLTLPVSHMQKSDEFRDVFLIALGKGGVFATP